MGMQQFFYRKHFIVSVVLHVIIFFILAMGFEFHGKNFVLENTNNQQIINAVVMTPSLTPPQPIVKPAPPVQAAPPPPKPIVKQVAPTPVVKKPPLEDAIALNAKKQLQQQKLLEKQLLADLNKEKAKQKKSKQKALENAFENEIKNLSAKAAQQKQDQRMAAEREQKAQGQVDKYKALILQSIGKHWIIPSGADKKASTEIMIYLAPGGMVIDAEIYKSSGNPAVDSSARSAVFKASPLPVPTDSDEFKFFRRFVLVFRPMYFQNAQLN